MSNLVKNLIEYDWNIERPESNMNWIFAWSFFTWANIRTKRKSMRNSEALVVTLYLVELKLQQSKDSTPIRGQSSMEVCLVRLGDPMKWISSHVLWSTHRGASTQCQEQSARCEWTWGASCIKLATRWLEEIYLVQRKELDSPSSKTPFDQDYANNL